MSVPAASLTTWSADDVARHLRARGVDVGAPLTTTTLSGGVSGVVLRVDGPAGSAVLKQALPRLAVPQPWEADPRRLLTEAAALRTLHALAPEHVPAVLDCDEHDLVLAMDAAPADWPTWKELLLTGQAAPEADRLATDLGLTVRRWHDATRERQWDAALGERDRFAPRTDFAALRLEPFYARVAAVVPRGVGDALTALAHDLAVSTECLVHGDLSPKNVLVGGPGVDAWWLLDAECAVLSDPVFDVAFLVAHLLLKSLDQARTHLVRTAQTLWTSYSGATPAFDEHRLTAHVAAIMLARVAGVSQVHYLTPEQRARVRGGAQAALLRPPGSLAELAAGVHAREVQR